MRRSLPWSVGDQQHVASVVRRWRKSRVHLECPRLCFLRALPTGMLGSSVATSARGACQEDDETIAASACEASLTIITPGRARRQCAVTLRTNGRTLQPIGQEDINPPLAGRQDVAVLTSGRGSGGGRGGPVSSVKKGTAPPTQGVPCDPQGARACRRAGRSRIAPVRRSADRARCPGQHQEVSSATPRSARHAVCAPSFSSWNFFQYGRLTAVRRPTCQALTQSCGRDRAMTASASAVTLRGIPQCHGEHLKPTVRTRSTSESGTVQISSATSSCAASEPRRSDSIAERESVAAGTRVGDRDAAARRGTENCLWPSSVAGHSARQEHARLPAAAR
ncbi:hypothetical protein TcCL_NonESM12059 [Trypanosoma cruzi]|nr:hypothetical protein TcCL_NonESM12059 [Trypanosoma cruzi]